jgi:hypothetical protein
VTYGIDKEESDDRIKLFVFLEEQTQEIPLYKLEIDVFFPWYDIWERNGSQEVLGSSLVREGVDVWVDRMLVGRMGTRED